MKECCDTDAPILKDDEKKENVSGSNTVFSTSIFSIPQMDCATEVSAIQSRFEGNKNIQKLKFDVSKRTLTVNHNQISQSQIIKELDAIGLKASPVSDSESVPKQNNTYYNIRLGIAGVLAAVAEGIELSGRFTTSEIAVATLAVLSILIGGIDVYKKGLIALKNKQLNINALMSVAVTGALVIRQWPEAAMVMFLFSFAELIEAKSFDKARNAFKKLMELAPETASVKGKDGTWSEVSSSEIALDSLVRVRPGERIALDGIISKGVSSINQAPITGESVPVEKKEGDKVFAGTINESSEIEFKVTATSTTSTLARIVETVDSAQGARAPTQRFIDNFSRYYTPSIFFLAVAIAIAPPLLGFGTWADWFYKALVLLVIACPCALVISTPVSIVSALSGAAKRGILIKGGVYLEQGKKLKMLALDKTGTLTFGKPEQTDFEAIGKSDIGVSRSIAASLASRSDHPVSKAVVKKAVEDKIQLLEIENFSAIVGKGTRGSVQGREYFLANHRFIEELKVCSDEVEKVLNKYEAEGKTVTILASNTEVFAIFAVMDTVRPTSKEAIDQLHKLGVQTMMLSGDNQLTAEKIGKEVGVDVVKGHLLPENKMDVIKQYVADKKFIGMVGDGINDAPALAISDIGFSMGVAGTDIAIETSDVAIMDDDLRKIPEFIKLSKRTSQILAQNISVAIAIKVVFLVLTLMGISTMWMAIFADTGASLIVVANGLRLSR
jgi:Cd2+/Zn2+-exporting ATPase